MLSFTASPFGTSPSLARIEIREISGGGLNLAVPIQGVQDGDWWDFNLGTPSEGTIHLMVSAVNNLEEYSEPLSLELQVLRDDTISMFLPYDFEVSRDGTVGVLLTASSTSATDMRVEFIDLSDPTNPMPLQKYITLDTGVTGDYSASGNVLVSPTKDMAYVLLANSYYAYALDINTLSEAASSNIQVLPAPKPGNGLTHANRAPFATLSPDGRYLLAVVSGALQVIVIDTESLATADIPKEQIPVTGLGPMVVRPAGDYAYFINGWGDSEAGSGTVNIFNMADQTFVDLSTRAGGVQGATIQSPGQSEYLIGQQPLVTPSGSYLLTTWCKGGSGSAAGDTLFTLLSLEAEGASHPSFVTETALYTTGGSTQKWGVPAAVSPDGKYLLIADGQPNLGGGLVVDLGTSTIVPNVSFANGVADGVFLSPTRVLTTSSDWTNRHITIADLAQGTTEELVIPGLTGLAPPRDDNEMRNNIVVQSGNYVYLVAPAIAADANGNLQTLGTTMSVYDTASGRFVFPNPVVE